MHVTHEPSRLASGILLDWCDGVTSAQQLRVHMANALSDGLAHPMVVRLSRVANDDAPQHSHAGMMELLGRCGILALLTPVLDATVTHMVLPSTIVKVLHDSYPIAFRRRLGANKSLVRRFWVGFFSRPQNREWALQHPELRGKGPDDLATTVPCSIHEDAGPYTKTSSCNCVSLSSLIGDGDEKITKFLSFSYIKSAGSAPTGVAWEKLLADFDCLAAGSRADGPIAQDADGTMWRFVLLVAKGDEDVHCNEWGLPHYGGQEVCSDCLANRVERPFTDLRELSAWRPTERMPFITYMARVRVPLHPLMASRYCTRWFAISDLMHMMDCKGVAALACGGVLFGLLKQRRLGANKEERLKVINQEMKQWYDDHPGTHRLPPLLLKNATCNGWADLSGPAIKAANTRAAAPVFKYLAHRFCDSDSDYDRCVRTVMDNLVRFYDILYTAPMFLEDAQIGDLKRACLDFGAAYQQLRDIARVRGELAWPVRPKVHRMQHAPMHAEIINPVFVQCYAEESLIGTTTKVWRRSAAGRYRRTVQETVLAKRLTGLLLRLEV